MVRKRIHTSGNVAPLLIVAITMLSFVPTGQTARDERPSAGHAAVVRPRPLPSGDADRDGLADDEELALAVRYAPVVVLDPADRYRPASVDWLLARLSAPGGSARERLAAALGGPGAVLPPALREGSRDPRDWVTYLHVYPRADGGINVQYWFFYPYNGGVVFDHDADWEHVTVHLDDQRRPREVMFAQHGNNRPGEIRPWAAAWRDGDHPIALAALGDHASYPDRASAPWFEQVSPCTVLAGCGSPMWRTWEAGGLVNIGERNALFETEGAFAYDGRWGRTGGWFALESAPRSPPHQKRSFQSAGFD